MLCLNAHSPCFDQNYLNSTFFDICLPPDDSYMDETDCSGRLLVSKTYIYSLYLYDIEHSLVFRGLNHIRIYIYIYSTICRHAHVSAFHALSARYMLERDDHRTYVYIYIYNDKEVLVRLWSMSKQQCIGHVN